MWMKLMFEPVWMYRAPDTTLSPLKLCREMLELGGCVGVSLACCYTFLGVNQHQRKGLKNMGLKKTQQLMLQA